MKTNQLQATVNPDGLLIGKLANKYLAIIEKGIIEENELNAMFSFLNGGRGNATQDEKKIIKAALWMRNDIDKPLLLSQAQNNKGINYLRGQYQTPNGKERKNNPFGFREVAVLQRFTHFELIGEYDAGNAYISFLVPLYRVVGEGGTFEYYFSGGVVHIIG